MGPPFVRQHPPPRGACDQALLQQVRLDHLLQRVARFSQGGGDGLDPHRPAVIILCNQRQIAPVRPIQTQGIHPKARQRAVGDLLGQPSVTFNNRKINHPAQKPPRDPGCPTGAFGDFSGSLRISLDFRKPRATGHDLVKLLNRIEIQPRRDAKTIAQRCGQQAKACSGTNQREGLQFNPHRTCGGALADHQIQLKILKRGVEDFFHNRVQTVDFINKQNVLRLKVGQDRRQITGLGQHRTRGHAEPNPQFLRHDLCQRGFPKSGRAVKQHVIHRLATHFGTLDEHPQIGPRLFLAGEIVQGLRAQRTIIFGAVVFGQGIGAQGGIRF